MIPTRKKNISFYCVLLTVIFTSNIAVSASNEPVQLNNNTQVERFAIDPNNGYVVFNEFDIAGELQRYTTQIDGQSSAIQIGINVNETRNGDRFSIDPNNSRIISRLDNPLTGDRDFLSVSINGDNSTLLRPTAPTPGDVNSTSIRSLDNILVFDIVSGGLFSVPNNGSAPAINLSNPIDPGNVDIGRIRRTQDGSIVVFDAELDAISEQALFSVPVDGSSNPTRLTPLNDKVVNNFTITDDQSHVVYVEESGPGSDFLEQQLFIVPIDGSSAPIALTDLTNGFSFSEINFTISPDGAHVVYTLPNFSSGVTQLFRVTTDGQSDPVLIDEGSEVHQFEITNNSETVIYSITQPLNGFLLTISDMSVLYSSPLLPSDNVEPILLSSSSMFNGELTVTSINIDVPFVITQNSEFVFYIQPSATINTGTLRRVTISNPSEFLTISTTPPPSDSIFAPFGDPDFVRNFKLSDDESFIVYLFSSSILDPFSTQVSPIQLSKISLDGSKNELLNTSTVGNVLNFEISDNNEYVVFTTDFESTFIDSFTNLYSLSLSDPELLCFPIKAKNGNFVTICL